MLELSDPRKSPRDGEKRIVTELLATTEQRVVSLEEAVVRKVPRSA